MAIARMKRKGKTTKKAAKGKKSSLKVVKSTKGAKKSSKMTKKRTTINVSSPMSKSQLMNCLAENSGLSRKEVVCVYDCLLDVVKGHVSGRGPEIFTLPGLLKIAVIHKPATKARKGTNPFTGEPTIFKAKPARRVVKIRPLKKLKEMV